MAASDLELMNSITLAYELIDSVAASMYLEDAVIDDTAIDRIVQSTARVMNSALIWQQSGLKRQSREVGEGPKSATDDKARECSARYAEALIVNMHRERAARSQPPSRSFDQDLATCLHSAMTRWAATLERT